MRMYPPRPCLAPETVMQSLAEELEALGVRVLDTRACSRVGLLVSRELVVWCYGPRLHWHQNGREMTWLAADTIGAARRMTGAASGGHAKVPSAG